MKYKNGAGAMNANYVVHFVKANATLTSSDRVWVDDVYVDTTWARVMLGNASTLSASTRIEPQIPSAWSTSGVTVTVNTGTFAANETAYLFVVDSTDATSSGYPLTLGGTVDPDPVNGSCGSNDGATLASLTSGDVNNCGVGAASAFSGTGPWTWTCLGADGGTDDSCSASLSSGATVVSRGTVPF